MFKGLLISDNSLISDIYEINMRVYVDVELEIKSSISEGLSYLKENHKDLNIIVIFSRIEGGDCGLAVSELIQAESIKLPIVMVGEKSDAASSSEIHTVSANFDVKPLLKISAKLLGITSREMVEKDAGKYYSLTIRMFKEVDLAPCDIFYLATKSGTQEEYVQLAASGSLLRGKISKYIESGVSTLYVKAEDRLKITNVVSSQIVNRLKDLDTGNLDDIHTAVGHGHDFVATHISHDGELNEELVSISKECVKVMIDVSKKDSKLQSMVKSILENKQGYLYTHAILASFVAKHIINNIDWGAKEHIEKLQFVFFFHDIHLAPIYAKYPDAQYEEELLFSGILSDEEKDLLIGHAARAAETVRKIPNAPLGVDTLILQHHGMVHGEGFAIEYGEIISPLAKVVVVSEEFVNGLLRQKDKGDLSEIDVEGILEQIHDKFVGSPYKKIIKTLENIHI